MFLFHLTSVNTDPFYFQSGNGEKSTSCGGLDRKLTVKNGISYIVKKF